MFALVHRSSTDYSRSHPPMPALPTLADRAWYALHCLPRDEKGKPPTGHDLERRYALSNSALSNIWTGRKRFPQPDTFAKVCRALAVSEAWLRGDRGATGPTLTGFMPPRPGMPWIRYGDVPGWAEAVTLAKLDTIIVIPDVAYELGAEWPVMRPIERMTPELARAASLLAYEHATPEEQTKYTTI